ncbi:Uncharacterised protein [Mycobacteroides abscessus]|nr:Uncharacterised protein [Mycobacteroides abscessus]
MNVASSLVTRSAVPCSAAPLPAGSKGTRKTGPRPSSSAVTSRPEPSGSQRSDVGQRSQ